MSSLFTRTRSRTRDAKHEGIRSPVEALPHTPIKEGSRWRRGGAATSAGGVGEIAESRGEVDELGRLKIGKDNRVRVISEPDHQTSHTPARKVNPTVPSRSLLGTNSSLATFHHHSGSTTSETSTKIPVAHNGGSLIEPPVDRYSFLPTRTPNLNTEVERTYGYIGVNTGLVLGLEDVLGVVEDVGKQLNERGLETPMLFSTKALDLNATKVKFLIDSYIKTLSTNGRTSRAQAAYIQNMRFAHPHEIAWFLRWALARVVRLRKVERVAPGPQTDVIEQGSIEARGLLEWEDYENWRGRERDNHHDKRYFETFIGDLPPVLILVLSNLFTILSRLSAHSHVSGCNPMTLSTHFGPLLFGCGPPSCSFDIAHKAYVRSAGATEHLLLAFIRLQDAVQERLQGGIPRMLRDWIKGYPSMIMSDRVMDQGMPRKGVKVIKVERATRVVRAYSKDLLRTCPTWADEMKREGGTEWPVWDRVVLKESQIKTRSGTRLRPSTDPRLPKTTDAPSSLDVPQLTAIHCKRLNLDVPFFPSLAFATPSIGRGLLTSCEDSATDSPAMPHTPVANHDKYGSLIDQAWGVFEGAGFDSGKSMSRILEFDLTEGDKERVKSKRDTMSWNDFAAPTGGFERSSEALSNSLTFSPTAQKQIESWPEEREELRMKLKKSQKEMVKFDWDTTPVAIIPGRGEAITVIEEGFVDVWADLLLSSGWTHTVELTYRQANWALVEYKALPIDIGGASRTSPTTDNDPRTTCLLFCFEEFFPNPIKTLFKRLKPENMVSSVVTRHRRRCRRRRRRRRLRHWWIHLAEEEDEGFRFPYPNPELEMKLNSMHCYKDQRQR